MTNLQETVRQYQEYIRAEKWQEALKALSILIEAYPQNLQLYERRGQLHLKLGAREAAFQDLQWVMQEYSKRGEQDKVVQVQQTLSLLAPTKEEPPVGGDIHAPPSSESELSPSVPLPAEKPLPLNPYLSPLLSTLEKEERQQLLRKIKVHNLPPRWTIFTKGDLGRSIYIVAKGKVELIVTDREGDSIIIAALQEGDHFGEMAYLTGYPREVTAITRTETQLWEIQSTDLYPLLQHSPKLARRLEGSYRTRLHEMLEKLKKLGTDRRKEVRVSVKLPVLLDLKAAQGKEVIRISGETLDIAVSGMQVKLDSAPPIDVQQLQDQEGEVSFSLSTEARSSFVLPVKIVRVTSRGNRVLLGLLFTDMEEKVRNALKKFVTRHILGDLSTESLS